MSHRHRWSNVRDPKTSAERRGFVRVCTKCGCRRDRSSLIYNAVVYVLNGERTHHAPTCASSIREPHSQ